MILRKDTGVKDFNNRTVYEGDYILFIDRENKVSDKPIAIKYDANANNVSEEYFNIYNPECCNCCKYGSGCICGLNEAIEHGGLFIIVGTIFGDKQESESRMRYFN